MTPEAIKHLAEQLSKLPSLGPRQATRLSFYLAGLPRDEVNELADAVKGVASIKRCTDCFSLAAETNTLHAGRQVCDICSNPRRDQAMAAIVEKETDLQTLEKTKAFSGRYLVLGLLPKDGVLSADQKRRLERLKKLPPAGGAFDEVIIALSPTTYGDLNASLIAHELRAVAKKITRLGRGIPTGAEIEFADEETLLGALKNRS